MTKNKQENPESLLIRRLWPAEADLFIDHFKHLDDQSRAMRFGGAVHESFIENYARSALSADGIVFGAFVNGSLVGVGEVKFATDAFPWRAEAAFSVVSEWQDHGIGTALLDRIIAVAKNRSVSGLDLWCRTSNSAMRRLAEHHDAELEFEHDEAHGIVRVPWPTPASVLEEFMGEAIGLGGFIATMSMPGHKTQSGSAAHTASAA